MWSWKSCMARGHVIFSKTPISNNTSHYQEIKTRSVDSHQQQLSSQVVLNGLHPGKAFLVPSCTRHPMLILKSTL